MRTYVLTIRVPERGGKAWCHTLELGDDGFPLRVPLGLTLYTDDDAVAGALGLVSKILSEDAKRRSKAVQKSTRR